MEEEEEDKEAEIKNEEIGSGHTSVEEVRNKGKGLSTHLKFEKKNYQNISTRRGTGLRVRGRC